MNTNTRTALTQQDDAMPWHLTNRVDPRGAALADRHYSRKTPGAVQFTTSGRCVVLLTSAGDALWVSSWPYPQYVKHDWRSYQQGRDFCRYFNTYGWRSYPIWEYQPRKDEPRPFALLRPQEASA